jgi:hypothetical protein
MSDATLVAAEIQDLASTVGEVAAAIRSRPEPVVTVNVPDQPAPVVNVHAAEQLAPQVTVNVPEQPAPVVNVAPAAAAVTFSPQVNVPRTQPNAYDVRITERDREGYIVAFTIVPQAAAR